MHAVQHCLARWVDAITEGQRLLSSLEYWQVFHGWRIKRKRVLLAARGDDRCTENRVLDVTPRADPGHAVIDRQRMRPTDSDTLHPSLLDQQPQSALHSWHGAIQQLPHRLAAAHHHTRASRLHASDECHSKLSRFWRTADEVAQPLQGQQLDHRKVRTVGDGSARHLGCF